MTRLSARQQQAHASPPRTDLERAGWMAAHLPAWHAAWAESGLTPGQFVARHRAELDDTIDAVLGIREITRRGGTTQ